MPPKGPSNKNVAKKAEKIAEDLTFGLKNKVRREVPWGEGGAFTVP